MNEWTDDFGHTLVGVHQAGTCLGDSCPLHNVSEHPLKGSKQRWNRPGGFMERICSHDIAHPDPDDYKARAVVYREHGCDGCCVD
jgi:hypothetical protein